jgi:histidinol phosphatase-like enzyme
MTWSRQESTSDAAIFIDRDGSIICRRANDYGLDWSQFVFCEVTLGTLRKANPTVFSADIVSPRLS